MAGVIILSAFVSGSTTDILQGTRLQTVPRGGFLTFEMQADEANSTNSFNASIQLPSGDTPMESVLVPGTDAGTAGILDEREKLLATFAVAQGGHCVFGVTLVGAAELIYRITYTPAG